MALQRGDADRAGEALEIENLRLDRTGSGAEGGGDDRHAYVFGEVDRLCELCVGQDEDELVSAVAAGDPLERLTGLVEELADLAQNLTDRKSVV